MEIVLLYRKKNVSAKSIEGVFRILKKEFNSKNIAVVEEYLDSNYIVFFFRVLFSKVKVYHITGDIYFTSLILKLALKKVVITFHDLGYYKNLRGIKRTVYFYFWIYFPLKLSDFNIFISEYTKNEFLRISGLNPIKSSVIYNPASRSFYKEYVGLNYANPSVLIVGTEVHKNIESSIRALAGMHCNLIIIGKLTTDQIDLLNKFSLNYINYFDISLIEIVNLYHKCDIVSFVSIHEGFGLPILEAQMANKIIITSNVCSLPEVAGSGAILVDPLDLRGLRNAFKYVMNIENRNIIESIISKGRVNLERFNSERISTEYIEIYKLI